jgi:adenylosuccinate lyase
VHCGCNSEDINNTSHALQLKSGRDWCCCPHAIILKMRKWRWRLPTFPCSARRTHGQQPPTNKWREVATLWFDQNAREKIANIPLMVK